MWWMSLEACERKTQHTHTHVQSHLNGSPCLLQRGGRKSSRLGSASRCRLIDLEISSRLGRERRVYFSGGLGDLEVAHSARWPCGFFEKLLKRGARERPLNFKKNFINLRNLNFKSPLNFRQRLLQGIKDEIFNYPNTMFLLQSNCSHILIWFRNMNWLCVERNKRELARENKDYQFSRSLAQLQRSSTFARNYYDNAHISAPINAVAAGRRGNFTNEFISVPFIFVARALSRSLCNIAAVERCKGAELLLRNFLSWS
jgi:hypothetical protein